MPHAVLYHRQNIQFQESRYMESTLVETSYRTILRTGSLGIDHYAVASFHQRLEFWQYRIYAHGDGIILGIPQDYAEEWTVPYPVVCKDYQIACL